MYFLSCFFAAKIWCTHNTRHMCKHSEAYEAETPRLLLVLLLLEAVLGDDIHLVPLPHHPRVLEPGPNLGVACPGDRWAVSKHFMHSYPAYIPRAFSRCVTVHLIMLINRDLNWSVNVRPGIYFQIYHTSYTLHWSFIVKIHAWTYHTELLCRIE